MKGLNLNLFAYRYLTIFTFQTLPELDGVIFLDDIEPDICTMTSQELEHYILD